MNSTELIQRRSNFVSRWLSWPLLGGLLVLALARVAPAAENTYTIANNAIINYPANQSYPPVIDATNFVNNGTFIINFTTLSLVQPFYETSDTLNYTNGDTALMMVNTGFNFDNQSTSTGLRTMSASFVNSGMISCGSTNNTGDPFGGLLSLTGLGYDQCLINATNIVNPGVVDVGVDGLMQFTGQHVDLSRSTLNMEGAGANVAGSGAFGLDTNGDWDPSIDLGPNYADSSLPFIIFLTNSTAYIQPDGLGTSNVIYRAVFIEDYSGSNISYNVYFGNIGVGTGSATVEWIGSYQDVASGNSFNNYLYLNDDYVQGAQTNVAIINGYPANFAFTESNTRLPIGVAPAPAGFSSVFPAGVVTNRYAYANAQLISTTATTNSVQDANGAITNLPGRIQISAANELDMSFAQITGPNYLSVQASNQFDGSAGATIQAPYADINIGVTNGFLTVSNLMAPSVPNWSGTVQAWSTRWLAVVNGVTNDFRVLIVGSQLTPTAASQVQDLILHGTNSIVISDTFNILRTFTADAQNLTLTTNGAGVGATSLDGEVNVGSSSIFWASSLPNLCNLTNNGAIRFQNLAQFNGNSNILTVTPAIPAVAATGKLSETNITKNVTVNNKVVIGTNQYVFVSLLTNTIPNQVKIATKFDGSLSNLIAAINHAAGAGTTYSTATKTNAQVVAGPLTSHAFTVTARTAGAAGNLIQTAKSTSTANLVWSSTYLAGGVDYVAAITNIASTVSVPYANFINNGLLSDQGSQILADNFVNSGTVSNGVNSFSLASVTTTLTNGAIVAGGQIAITANSLVASNVMLQAGGALNLTVTNLLTDTGVTNGNFWSVQSPTGTGGSGLILPVKPVLGDLLGTTITNYAAGTSKQTINIWAGQDRGVSVNGYTNNVAVGQLFLDAVGVNSQFKFSGAGTSNALYVDQLVFLDQMTNGINNNYDFSANLSIGTNMMIYFAQAEVGGFSIASKINDASKAGRNGGRLRWVPAYAGYFSSTNLVYPDGTTNTFNAALAASTTIDSNGNGTPNASDPMPFFTASEINLTVTSTNVPPLTMVIQWDSIPGATNYVQYQTNMMGTWFPLTNFVSPVLVPPAGGWPITNTVFDPVNPVQQRFYGIKMVPNSTLFYGP